MSETIYRMKSKWIDGHKLVKTVDTHDVSFFNNDKDTYELGFQMFDKWGTFFRTDDGTAFSGEIMYDDILLCIDYLGLEELSFEQKTIDKVIKDFEYMKICCEKENEDFFQIYIL